MQTTEKIYDFFISHSTNENEEAEILANMLKEINPEWNIFFDKVTLRTENEWKKKMFDAIEHSKHLIYLAKSPETIKHGYYWVQREIDLFYDYQTTRMRNGKSHLNISYFGITYGWDLERDLFSDSDRGSEYRAIHKTPNHIFLNKDDTIADFSNTIKEKVLNMTAEEVNHSPSLILDRTYMYASVKKSEDATFEKEHIIDSIIPQLSSGNKTFSFDEILPIVEEKDIAIIGNEGGSGKTTMMTKLFFHFLEKACEQKASEALIPIYIDASTLAGPDYLIMRNIAKSLYNESTATSFTNNETAKIISNLEGEFSHNAKKPNYLLLIDGYNEIPEGVLSKFNDELKQYGEYSKYKNVRIVLSGRGIDEDVFREFFKEDNSARFNIERIADDKVKSFLKEKNISSGISPSLMKILSIPMYLTMYADTSKDDVINTRTDLLNNFIERQLLKDKDSSNDEKQEAQYKFLLKSLLPYIAFRLVTKGSAFGNFVLTYDEILDFTKDAREYFTSDDYIGYCGAENRKILRLSGIEETKAYHFVDYAIDYYTKVSKLLKRDDLDEEKFHFVHQVYRDFFAATHIFNDISFAAKTECPCLALAEPLNERDILKLILELLKEDVPFYVKSEGVYNYDCNKTSRLIKIIENSRKNSQCKDANFLRGAIYVLKHARKNDLSGCDFSGLDLTKANFCFAVLSTYDAKGSHPSIFKNSKINIENLLVNNPSTHIMAACTNDDTVAIFDSTGTLTLWYKGPFNNAPLKIINNISYRLHKIIFSKDNKSIYGMAGHTVVEIPIPEGKFGHDYKIICKTSTRLRDIFLDEAGEPCFTTAFNSYNSKTVSTPDTADTLNFYGINSASAVRHDKKQLAYGYIAGYNGLKIYNLDSESNTWVEQKIGVHLLIDEFVTKVEKFLKDAGIYEKFYSAKELEERDNIKNPDNFRCGFFEKILFDYNGYHSNYPSFPNRICGRIFNKMKDQGISEEEFAPGLTILKDEYKNLIADLEKNNRALTYMHGRKFSSIEYKPGTDNLLVTYYNEYDDKNGKHLSHSTVSELNTTDLSSKLVHIYSGSQKIEAHYSGDDMVFIAPEKLWVADKYGYFYIYSVIYGSKPRYFYRQGMDTFYMMTNTGVYEINSNFVCIKNFSYGFNRDHYSLVFANNSTPYLINKKFIESYNKKRSADDISPNSGLFMFNLNTGIWEKVYNTDEIIPCSKRISDFFGKTVTDKNGAICLYDGGSIECSIPIQRTLYVAGCDFSGISGSLTEPEYMDILNFYGAITDKKTEKKVIEKITPKFSYTPSDVPFEEPKEFKNFTSPYIFDENDTNGFPNEKLPAAKHHEVWPKIQRASNIRNGFEPSDFSILEWIGWLDVLTPEMVYYLMEADQMERPSIYTLERGKVTKRMNKTLYQNLRLLRKYHNPKTTMPLYTLSSFPKFLLPQVTGAIFNNKPLNTKSVVDTAKILLLNLWYSYNLMKLKENVLSQRHNITLELENSLSEPVILSRYIKLDKGAIFPIIMRGALDDEKIREMTTSVDYFVKLASNYPLITCKRINEEITAAPTIVIICENLECCEKLNEIFENTAPHIRKLYTYDALIVHCTENNTDDMYIEFRDKKPYKVNISDLVL